MQDLRTCIVKVVRHETKLVSRTVADCAGGDGGGCGMTFEKGNKSDNKHYWLTPADLMAEMQAEFEFDYDPCPFPKPPNYDGLKSEWGQSNYVNPPFGSYEDEDGKKKGPTAWARKAIEEHKKGKRVVFLYPIDKWIHLLLEAGAKVRNLKDIHWRAIEDGTQGPGTGRHVAMFILEPDNFEPSDNHLKPETYGMGNEIKIPLQSLLFSEIEKP